MNTLLIKEIGLAKGYGNYEYHRITNEQEWRAFVTEKIGGWCFTQHQELADDYHTTHQWDTNEQMIEHIGNLWGYYVDLGIDFAKDLWSAFDHSVDHSLDYCFPDGLTEEPKTKTILTQMSVRVVIKNQEVEVPAHWTEKQIALYLHDSFNGGTLDYDDSQLHEYNCSYVEKGEDGEYDYAETKGDNNFI